MNGELKEIWKETFCSLIVVLFRQLPGGTWENYEETQFYVVVLTKCCGAVFNIFRTLHLRVILIDKQLDAQFLL